MEELVRAMDEASVSEAVVFGLPVVKEWAEWEAEEPSYYLSDNARCYYYSLTDALVARSLESLDPVTRKRFWPLLCGFNPTDRFCARQIEATLDLFPGVFHGIGEILCRHDDLTNLTPKPPARADHPALDDVYELAASRNLPILIHQNASAVGAENAYRFLDELVRALDAHRRTRIVWAHCGVSRRVSPNDHHEHVQNLLGEFENLHVDLSWDPIDDLLFRDGQPREEWVDLVERHSERVVLGSDLVCSFDKLAEKLDRFDPFLSKLSDSAQQDVRSQTARRLYQTNPAGG